MFSVYSFKLKVQQTGVFLNYNKMGFRRISAHILAARAVEAEPGTDKTEHLTLDNNPAKGFTDARGKPTGTVTHCIVIADNVRHTGEPE